MIATLMKRNERVEQEYRQRLLAVRIVLAAENRGAVIRAVAEAYGVTPRTVRRWVQWYREGRLQPKAPGPKPKEPDGPQRRGIMALVIELGPRARIAAVREQFGDVTYRVIGFLLRFVKGVRMRSRARAWDRLQWHRPGRVWACDFTEPDALLPDGAKKLFVVRDLASGMRLACLPCEGERAEVAISTLETLFATHGAPLVLKHDNGPGFRAEATQDFLVASGVVALASPAYRPRYNGSIERSLGWIKTTIEHIAEIDGHPGVWRQIDIDRAVRTSNEHLTISGPRGRTPHQVWRKRKAIHPKEREAFQQTVRQKIDAAQKTETEMHGKLQRQRSPAAIRRKAVKEALLEHKYLTIRRGRISTPLPPHQPDRNS